MSNDWTREWPKKAGRYWFYGFKFPHRDKPDLHLVVVWEGRDSANHYVTEGHFMYKSEATGWWQRAIEPDVSGIAFDVLMEGKKT